MEAKRYIGIDLHRDCFTACLRLENGREYLKESKLEDMAKFTVYGTVDAPLFRQPHCPRIHGTTLAAAGYRERTANKGAVGRQVVEWQHAVDRAGSSLRFGDLRVETTADHHVFEVELCLNDLDPNAVRVELLCGWNQRRRSDARGNEVRRQRPSRNRTRRSSSERLHGASDTPALRSGGSVGIGSNPPATLANPPVA